MPANQSHNGDGYERLPTIRVSLPRLRKRPLDSLAGWQTGTARAQFRYHVLDHSAL